MTTDPDGSGLSQIDIAPNRKTVNHTARVMGRPEDSPAMDRKGGGPGLIRASGVPRNLKLKRARVWNATLKMSESLRMQLRVFTRIWNY